MTTAAPGRVRRSIRYAQLEASSGAAKRENPLRRERMTVRSGLEVPSFQNTQDWTSGMAMSPSGRFRVIEEPREHRRVFSREGIREDWARTIIWLLSALMAVVLLVMFASVGASSLQIRKLEKRMETAQAKKLELQSRLSASGGDISVCTKAVELNLISSSGAPTIQLTAPEGATMVLVETRGAAPTEEPEMRASAVNTN